MSGGTQHGGQLPLEAQRPAPPALGALPLTCLSWNSVRKRAMRSEGMAKEMPAATLSVLMPMTSPSWVWGEQRAITLGPKKLLPSMQSIVSGPRTALAVRPPEKSLGPRGCPGGALGLTSGSGALYSPTVSSHLPSALAGAC